MKSDCGNFVRLDKDAAEVVKNLLKEVEELKEKLDIKRQCLSIERATAGGVKKQCGTEIAELKEEVARLTSMDEIKTTIYHNQNLGDANAIEKMVNYHTEREREMTYPSVIKYAQQLRIDNE